MFGQLFLLWHAFVVATDTTTVCSSFDGNCTACRLARESGATWGSPCLYLSSPAQGHRCQPAKWWAKYSSRFKGISPINCTRDPLCTATGSARVACWSGKWSQAPTRVPSGQTTDGPLLGDGETGVVFGVSNSTLMGYIGTNSFWRYNTDTYGSNHRSEQRGVGGVALAIAEAQVLYTFEQSPGRQP